MPENNTVYIMPIELIDCLSILNALSEQMRPADHLWAHTATQQIMLYT